MTTKLIEDAAQNPAIPPGVAAEKLATEVSYQRRLYDECVAANWDPELRNSFAEEIAHLHEELSEAFRAWRLYKNFDVHVGAGGKLEGIPI